MEIKVLKTMALLVAFLVLGVTNGVGQPFTVATLNVDGLPQTILGIPLNDDGPGKDGTERASQYLADKGYDIIGVQEDFYYHDELTEKLEDPYYWGMVQHFNWANLPWFHLDGLTTFDTDGLCQFWLKRHLLQGEDYVRWNDSYGRTDHCNDALCKKGFRIAQMKLANGRQIVIYNMHMDASEDADEKSGADWHDKEARWNQWRQLRSFVQSRLDDRPVIVMGDMNSYYTRDSILSLFIRPIEATGRYVVRDCWVEYSRQGIYPAIGTPHLNPWTYDFQRGEMLDKILYICPVKGPRLELLDYRVEMDYIRDNGKPIGDHRPVVAKFRIVEKGDANGDGVVNSADAGCAAHYLVGITTTGFSAWATDVNDDGRIDISDVIRIISMISRKG